MQSATEVYLIRKICERHKPPPLVIIL